MYVKEITAESILRPTSIDLSEYVINPYKGCYYGCMYCYARYNKSTLKGSRPWGDYLYVKKNALEILEKEIMSINPETVLLGSVTECFQPAEKEYGITEGIIKVLNKNKIGYYIMTRSPMVSEYTGLIGSGGCLGVYFTVNTYAGSVKELFEPRSSDSASRFTAIRYLTANNIKVIPYFSPVLPGISSLEDFFVQIGEVPYAELEGLNFNLGNAENMIRLIRGYDADIGYEYEKMMSDRSSYEHVWEDVREEVASLSGKYSKKCTLHLHSFGKFFNNTYRGQ